MLLPIEPTKSVCKTPNLSTVCFVNTKHFGHDKIRFVKDGKLETS